MWTYTDPTNNVKDAVRLSIGDTETTDQLLSDAEINYFVTSAAATSSANNLVTAAAIKAAFAIAAKFARKADIADGDAKITYSQKSKAYFSLAESLKKELPNSSSGAVLAGCAFGKSAAASSFSRGMMS